MHPQPGVPLAEVKLSCFRSLVRVSNQVLADCFRPYRALLSWQTKLGSFSWPVTVSLEGKMPLGNAVMKSICLTNYSLAAATANRVWIVNLQ